jgi:hypothetical protein
MDASVHAIAAIEAQRRDSMSAAAHVLDGRPRSWERFADPALRAAAALWLCVAVSGQLLFASYVAIFYGRAAAQGRLETWNKVLQTGYVPGDTYGNLVLFSHLMFAVAVVVSGALQLVPLIRRKIPRFHRWNGRFFLLSAVVASSGGLIMLWTRKSAGDMSQHIAISINALLILAFAGVAWNYARTRRFDLHRRWALRLFLVVSGGWFFRIGLMLWIVLNRGPVGFDPKTFTGPFLTVLSFAQYLLPLGVVALYFHAQARREPRGQLAMAAALLVLTLVTLGGTAAAAAIMWLPHI